MAHRATTVETAENKAIRQAQYRCLCCDGVIADLSEDTLPLGLDLRLGLVADECALICDACTRRLIEARALQAPPTGRR